MDRKLWEPLRRFESRDYVTRYYHVQHGRTLNAQRAHEIGSCFTQGQEYFSSASIASDAVKPLLLYYGMASLCRGVILLKNSRKKEESLIPGHGLIRVDWPATLHDGISSILDLKVQSTNGTFPEFVEAVGNGQSYSWLHQDGRAGGFKKDFGTPAFLQDDSRITLGDLLSRVPDLAAEYEIATGGWGNTDFGWVLALEESLRVHFFPTDKVDVLTAVKSYRFPATAVFSNAPNPRIPQIPSFCVEIPAAGEKRKRVAPMAVNQDSSLGWLVRPLPNGDNLIEIHMMFIEAFIYGMLSRYFPSKWMSLQRGGKGDIARSLILAAVERVERQFPKLLRDQIPC